MYILLQSQEVATANIHIFSILMAIQLGLEDKYM